MTSDEERHEVVRKLRVLACTPDEIGITEHAVIRDLGISAGIYDDCCKSEDVLAVADLIDPTCEMVVKYGHACCGRCGHVLAGEGEVEEGYYEFRPFCPDCGARVVRDDD